MTIVAYNYTQEVLRKNLEDKAAQSILPPLLADVNTLPYFTIGALLTYMLISSLFD